MTEAQQCSPVISEIDYLTNRLDSQIDWYSKKSQWNQKRYKFIKKTEMILSATIPIAMAFWSDNWYIKIYIAVAGGAIAVMSGIHGLYNFHENWIEYRGTSETLMHEKYMYLTRSGIYAEKENTFQTLVGRVESVISHENINWAQVNKRSSTKSEKSNGPTCNVSS